MMNEELRGPLFVFGLPRSGTKLLRDILNNHSRISIPIVESHFLPLFIQKYGFNFPFDDDFEKRRLLNDFLRTVFYTNMVNLGVKVNKEFKLRFNSVNSWESFGKLIFSHFGPKSIEIEGLICGDKTPGYVKHIKLLRDVFPSAKFIHIIRDPRDYALSVRNIWGKSMFRAAETWNRTIKHAATFTAHSDIYMETSYERLIEYPEEEMSIICDFLNIPYERGMCILKNNVENYGDAKDKIEIVKNNKQKFLNNMSQKEIKRVESLSLGGMTLCGYEPLYSKNEKKPTRLLSGYWRLSDAINSLVFHMKEKGIVCGIKYFFKLHHQSSWH